jgi:hypothetical protein
VFDEKITISIQPYYQSNHDFVNNKPNLGFINKRLEFVTYLLTVVLLYNKQDLIASNFSANLLVYFFLISVLYNVVKEIKYLELIRAVIITENCYC